MKIISNENSFEVFINDHINIISHSKENPAFYIGLGEANYDMYRGNFKINDNLINKFPLTDFKVDSKEIHFYHKQYGKLILKLKSDNDNFYFEIVSNFDNEKINRFWIRINSDKNEKIFGCGEQLSYFNLKGRNFPIWTSEPGVGRNKKTFITQMADLFGKAGGDYFTTNYPQPTYISNRKYYFHVDSTVYMNFDFSNDDYNEIEIWEIPSKLIFNYSDNYINLLEKLTSYLGRQPILPKWLNNGIILGVQGGTETIIKKLNSALENNIPVSALWVQDWQGKRITSFGKRLMWNWKWNDKEYPELDKKIIELKNKNIKFLGYINCYLAVEGDLFKEAEKNGYLALNSNNQTYLVDFGEFNCGIVDLTNPDAFNWYKNVIINNLINFGLDGWMADFGEYLPTDCYLYNKIDAKVMHNLWPTLWAKVNYEAIKETNNIGKIVFFMRAGYSGFQKYCPLMWAGDQSVNWSLDDGLASVIPASLSSGISGMGLHHSDIGGYTSLFTMKRSKELFMRWVELSAFSPVMRTHEGNRPEKNFQFDEDKEALNHLSRMTKIFIELKPYIKKLIEENHLKGTPLQRPLFFHYEEDLECYDIKYQYLFGKDLLVAPVYKKNINQWEVYLPKDNWIHLWSKQEYNGGYIKVNAELGFPPVFFRKDSEFYDLFMNLNNI